VKKVKVVLNLYRQHCQTLYNKILLYVDILFIEKKISLR
jgi:hypothetical protein